ncbi:MAG: DUF4097 family beta strand repeat protein [Ignavibacteriae bacterium]|nr:DUF4097 family beta strand repeat protein [Ignavibacteriota bacterium]
MKQTRMTILVLFAILSLSTSYAQRQGASKSQSFSVTKGGTLEVSINSGSISIATWDKPEVTLKLGGMDLKDDGIDKLTISHRGNVVRVHDDDLWEYGEDVHLDVMVPDQFNLDLNTSLGDLTLRGTLTGNVEARTSAGEISLGDVTGSVNATTSGGDVTAGNLTGSSSLKTSGGDIRVSSCGGDLEAKTAGGDVRIGKVGKSLRAATAGGDITVDDVNGEATVNTAGGNIGVGRVSGNATVKTAGGDISLAGASGSVRAVSSGGNLTLHSVSGSLEAKTAGGDIRAELLPSGKGKSTLNSAAGTIRLYVPENAKATIEARIRVMGRWKGRNDDFSIRSDFKEEPSTREVGDREITARYILNGGGELISVETVNSDIEIRKLRK